MERILEVELDNGMDSCLRVLSILRTKRINVNGFNMIKDDLILKVDENIYKEVHLFLSKLADIKLK